MDYVYNIIMIFIKGVLPKLQNQETMQFTM